MKAGKRVLILSASVGTGHVRAGDALTQAFMQLDSTSCVQHEDALEFANPAFRNIVRKAYADLASKAPEVLGWIYDYTDRVWTTVEHGNAFERWNTHRLIKFVSDFNPDIVVCTHPLPADMTSWLLCKKKLDAQHSVVITDFEINPMWLCHHYSMYFVATTETKVHMIQLGYDSDRIVVSGIPVANEFSQPKDKIEMRKKHGLNPQRTTIMVSAGGAGLIAMEEIVASLLDLDSNFQIVAACGSNEALKERVEKVVESYPSQVPVKVMSYTPHIDEIMSASDMIIGKPGGLTSSEALVKGLAFIIVNPIPGQEERNSDYLLENGAAIRCNNLPVLHYKVSQLLKSPERMESLRARARAIAHPSAASDIANKLMELSENTANQNLVHPADHKCESFLEGLATGISLTRDKEK